MPKKLTTAELLFKVIDVFGRSIRTSKNYWDKIRKVKHTELRFGVTHIKKTLVQPDEVRLSVTDSTILLYAKKVAAYDILIVAVKILNGEGFVITVYQTKIYKKKGKLLWPKEKAG